MKNLIGYFVAMVLFTGCIIPPSTYSVPDFNFLLSDVVVSHKKINAELKSVSVYFAKDWTPSETLRPIPAVWKLALMDAANSMAIFKDDSKNKLNISVKILEIDTPTFGGTMKTKVIAHYDLIDRASGYVIYSEEVESLGVVDFSFAFEGALRARESCNRAVQSNIAAFLEDLENLNIDNLMPKP